MSLLPNFRMRQIAVVLSLSGCAVACPAQSPAKPPARVAKTVLAAGTGGESLLRPNEWRPFEKGFARDGATIVCDNAADGKARRGATQTLTLDQTQPEPIVATCWSRAEGITGGADADYSLYLDLIYADGTPLWGQTAAFSTGTHDWQRRQVVVLPEKPVKTVSVHLLLRGHGGKAAFRDAELKAIHPPAGACLFDGLPVVPNGPPVEGLQLRDVAAGSDFLHVHEPDAPIEIGGVEKLLGVEVRELGTATTRQKFLTNGMEVAVTDTTGKDRALTLLFAVPVEGADLHWLDDPRRSTPVAAGREYTSATQFHSGSNGRLSRWPLGAVADGARGVALAMVPDQPAFHRIGYNAGSKELYIACDFALTPERPRAEFRFRHFAFAGRDGFRGALDRYYSLYPEAFRCRTPQQGLWMPFAKISKVPRWEDFGFKFKEGNDETEWDDRHDILTFRYTEPMTWWMPMPKELPRTLAAAEAEARRLADQGSAEAKALFTSGHRDAAGRLSARILDTPWCNGAVWSMNSMPGMAGKPTDFENKWNAELREKLYGPRRKGDLDGEYVDSSEGYVTDEIDLCRSHFRAAHAPLVFSTDDRRPGIFRGLIAWEYVHGIAADVHGMDKLMMANATPDRVWWLAPLLDVMGTETDWHPGGMWRPMSDADMLYRRAMCKGKPYCFLMNTRFDTFSHELVEKYMRRCLAYGMFPGFFSADASTGHYFTRPELYDRDRPLFRRYVPLCKRVAEAGWEPLTRARSDDGRVYVERFGDRLWTIFNDSPQRRTATIAWDDAKLATGRELLSGKAVTIRDGKATITLDGEDVAVVEAGR